MIGVLTVVLTVLHILLCLFLILVVLLQPGRGGGMGGAFGGMSQTVFGSRGAGSFLAKMTAVVAALFMANSFALSKLSSGGGDLPEAVEDDRGTSTILAPGVEIPSPTDAGAKMEPPPAATPAEAPAPEATGDDKTTTLEAARPPAGAEVVDEGVKTGESPATASPADPVPDDSTAPVLPSPVVLQPAAPAPGAAELDRRPERPEPLEDVLSRGRRPATGRPQPRPSPDTTERPGGGEGRVAHPPPRPPTVPIDPYGGIE